MTFPVSSVLDNFDRANGAVGSSWSKIWSGDLSLYVNTNAVANDGSAGWSNGGWNPGTFGADCEAYLTLTTVNTSGMNLYARMSALNTAGGPNGYRLSYNGDGTWNIQRLDAGSTTTLGAANIARTIANGAAVGLEIVGATLTFYYKASGGSWSAVTTRTDATYRDAGYIGMEFQGNTWRGDNFGGGTISPILVNITHDTSTNLTDASNYTSSSGPDISIASGAALAGTVNGLNVLVDDTTADYGIKSITANTSGKVRARFYLSPNSITMAANDEMHVLSLKTSAGVTFGSIRFSKVGSNYTTAATLTDDLGNPRRTTDYTISNAAHYVEAYWTRATTSVSADGDVYLYIDGALQGHLAATYDNYDKFADFGIVWMGCNLVAVGTPSGTFYMDELVINDDGSTIGPVASTFAGKVSTCYFG
jgi:hypothetical protein